MKTCEARGLATNHFDRCRIDFGEELQRRHQASVRGSGGSHTKAVQVGLTNENICSTFVTSSQGEAP